MSGISLNAGVDGFEPDDGSRCNADIAGTGMPNWRTTGVHFDLGLKIGAAQRLRQWERKQLAVDCHRKLTLITQ
ncbi:hypothetical protein AO062_11445 [Variovorax boronicumulans]|nr:hypothetical protein AO062_11445 [Variovorax boronicumulans]